MELKTDQETWFYRGYKIETTSVGSDILAKEGRAWVYIETKVPRDKVRSIIDTWLSPR